MIPRFGSQPTPATTPDLTPPRPPVVAEAVARALVEDLSAAGDVTSDAVVPADARLRAAMVARTGGCVAGVVAAIEAFAQVDREISVSVEKPDGSRVAPLDTILKVSGPARSMLTGERTALNFMTHLSGIASLTAQFVDAVDGAMARIVGTRKTTPGLRALELYAICAGGGARHRASLSDAMMIKDNHIAAAGGVAAAMMAARARAGHMLHISIEVDTLAQLDEALRYSPDVVLLDNFTVPELSEAVRMAGGRCVTEASGGVNLETVRAIADTGVDVISIGALTHSAPALDIGLDITTP